MHTSFENYKRVLGKRLDQAEKIEGNATLLTKLSDNVLRIHAYYQETDPEIAPYVFELAKKESKHLTRHYHREKVLEHHSKKGDPLCKGVYAYILKHQGQERDALLENCQIPELILLRNMGEKMYEGMLGGTIPFTHVHEKGVYLPPRRERGKSLKHHSASRKQKR